MQFKNVAAASALFIGSSLAQGAASSAAAPSASASGTPAGMVMVQTVMVGSSNGSLTFTPDDIQAPMGSMVQFQFYPSNHSVAQASFAQPCMPLMQTNTSATNQLWSGFMPTAQNASMMATYTVMINNTTPVWLYCAQGKHCQSGMVASINADNSAGSTKTLAMFKSAAANAQANVAPGGSSADGTVGSTSSNSTGSGSPASGSSGSGSGSGSGSSTAGSTAPSSTTNNKTTSAASAISYSMSSLALAGLLSAIVAFAL